MARQPAEVFPVCDFLLESMIEHGLNRQELAVLMSGDPDVNELGIDFIFFQGEEEERGIYLGQDTAEDFARIFGTSPEYWLNLDNAWRQQPLAPEPAPPVPGAEE